MATSPQKMELLLWSGHRWLFDEQLLFFLFRLSWKMGRGPLTWVTFSVTWWVLSISLDGGLISPGGNVTKVFAFVSSRLWVICRSHWGHRTGQGSINSLSGEHRLFYTVLSEIRSCYNDIKSNLHVLFFYFFCGNETFEGVDMPVRGD